MNEIELKVLWAPKEGNTEKEYEDAFYPNKNQILKGNSFKFAVADGATEDSFSKLWANKLVKFFCKSKITDSTKQLVSFYQQKEFLQLQEEWRNEVINIINNTDDISQCYILPKIELGANSTILYLHIKNLDENKFQWESLAIGDSCLIQIRNNQILSIFPNLKSFHFNNSPILISTNDNSHLAKYIQITNGDCQKGDYFYLMTDSIAQWFIKEIENNRKPYLTLQRLFKNIKIEKNNPKLSFNSISNLPIFGISEIINLIINFLEKSHNNDFLSFLKNIRQEKKIKNDDITIMQVYIL